LLESGGKKGPEMQGKRLKRVYNTRHSVAATKLVGFVAYNRRAFMGIKNTHSSIIIEDRTDVVRKIFYYNELKDSRISLYFMSPVRPLNQLTDFHETD
jgi:hypothetical protein